MISQGLCSVFSKQKCAYVLLADISGIELQLHLLVFVAVLCILYGICLNRVERVVYMQVYINTIK